ncbi:MAG: hypothetical protein E7377_02845 [Clostridiales bacterium]|nr:hypothetical protein [Clostridiales bacterium]
MNGKQNNQFRYACKEYLYSLSIGDLRTYGREIGVSKPTTMKKEDLIETIVGILCGDSAPTIKSNRGAPIKDSFIDPKIPQKIENLRKMYQKSAVKFNDDISDYAARLQEMKEKGEFVLTVEDPQADEIRKNGVRQIYKGQLETLNGVSMLLPLNCMDSSTKIVISVEMIRAYDLREGDVVTCYAEKRNSIYVATTVLTVNDLVVDTFCRGHFEEFNVCFPHKRINLYEQEKYANMTNKYLHWLLPIGRGQRGLIVAPPKAGATSLLLEVCRAASKLNGTMRVLTLLVDQSPENVSLFRKYVQEENLLYTTYEDDPERQVFVAEYLLKRAKRYAECGNDVLVIVDSLNSLARAYNDTDASLGGKTLVGGMESKTIQYLKRFFGTARCFEKGGSVTILGAVTVNSGNPADDLIRAELSAIGNYEVCLNEQLARKRMYPAIELSSSKTSKSGLIVGTRGDNLDFILRNEYLPKYSQEALYELLFEAKTYEDFEENVIKK